MTNKKLEAKIINIKAAVMIEAVILFTKEADVKYQLFCNRLKTFEFENKRKQNTGKKNVLNN